MEIKFSSESNSEESGYGDNKSKGHRLSYPNPSVLRNISKICSTPRFGSLAFLACVSPIWNWICPLHPLKNDVRGGLGIQTKVNYLHPVSGWHSVGQRDKFSIPYYPSGYHSSPPVLRPQSHTCVFGDLIISNWNGRKTSLEKGITYTECQNILWWLLTKSPRVV